MGIDSQNIGALIGELQQADAVLTAQLNDLQQLLAAKKSELEAYQPQVSNPSPSTHNVIPAEQRVSMPSFGQAGAAAEKKQAAVSVIEVQDYLTRVEPLNQKSAARHTHYKQCLTDAINAHRDGDLHQACLFYIAAINNWDNVHIETVSEKISTGLFSSKQVSKHIEVKSRESLSQLEASVEKLLLQLMHQIGDDVATHAQVLLEIIAALPKGVRLYERVLTDVPLHHLTMLYENVTQFVLSDGRDLNQIIAYQLYPILLCKLQDDQRLDDIITKVESLMDGQVRLADVLRNFDAKYSVDLALTIYNHAIAQFKESNISPESMLYIYNEIVSAMAYIVMGPRFPGLSESELIDRYCAPSETEQQSSYDRYLGQGQQIIEEVVMSQLPPPYESDDEDGAEEFDFPPPPPLPIEQAEYVPADNLPPPPPLPPAAQATVSVGDFPPPPPPAAIPASLPVSDFPPPPPKVPAPESHAVTKPSAPSMRDIKGDDFSAGRKQLKPVAKPKDFTRTEDASTEVAAHDPIVYKPSAPDPTTNPIMYALWKAMQQHRRAKGPESDVEASDHEDATGQDNSDDDDEWNDTDDAAAATGSSPFRLTAQRK